MIAGTVSSARGVKRLSTTAKSLSRTGCAHNALPTSELHRLFRPIPTSTPERTDSTMISLLEHAIRNNCQDPDCELHNIDVAIAEQVIGDVELAYYYAGAMMMQDLISNALDNGFDSAKAELRDQLALNGK